MPLYSFICDDCHDDFEDLVMNSSKIDNVICPKCGSHKVQRQLSLVAGLNSTTGSNSGAGCSPGGG
jgi:putative FmdB family regulatory protein